MHILGSTKTNYLRPVSVASVGILLADILRKAKSRESVTYACKMSPLKSVGRKSSLPALALAGIFFVVRFK